MSSYGLRFLRSVLHAGDVKEFLKFGKMDHVFALDPGSEDVYQFTKAYVSKTGQMPPVSLVTEETGNDLPPEPVDPAWLYDRMFETYVQRAMKLMVQEAQKDFQDDPLKAFESLVAGVRKIQTDAVAPKLSDFKEALTDFYPSLLAKWTNSVSTLSFGWPYMDDQGGGIWPGDVISLVGRPGLGKTWLLLFIALHIWETAKLPIVFVSMEMGSQIVMERLTSLWTKTAMDWFKHGLAPTMFVDANSKGMTKDALKAKLTELQNSDLPPFIVVDGNLTASVDDVVALCQQFQPGACLIDGAYMLSNGQTKSIYEAVAVNANMLKKNLATGLGIPTFCTWQFGREVTKLKKGEKPGLQHIGYSDVIGQVSTVVLGLFEQDETENVEKLYHRIITVLKGRNGEVGEFKVSWDFLNMNFAQYVLPEDTSQVSLME